MAFVARLPEDPQLPQLAQVTEVAAMQNILQRTLPRFADGDLKIDKLEISEFDYKPGRKCCLSYWLGVSDLRTGRSGYEILVGMIEPEGGVVRKYKTMQNAALYAPEFVPALHFLPEQNMLLWGFPNDPKIRHLAALVDPNRLRDLLQQHWPALNIPQEFALREVQTTVVK